jgi:hypothetical protein
MLNKISEKFHSWTTGWRLIILLIADALMMGYIMPLASQPKLWLSPLTTAFCRLT